MDQTNNQMKQKDTQIHEVHMNIEGVVAKATPPPYVGVYGMYFVCRFDNFDH